MKKKFLLLFFLIVFSASLSAEMTKSELQYMYLAYLEGQNINASIDNDGDIEFQYELPTYSPMTFYIIVNENDQEFFQILVSNIYSLDTNIEMRQAPIAASYATRIANTVKIYVNSAGTNVNASGEVFITSPENFRFVFKKMMLQFEVAFDAFLDMME